MDMRFCYGVGLVSLLILALISPRSSFAQESLFLETDASVQNLPAQQSRSLETLKARPTSAAVHVMRLADTPAALLEQGKALTLNVSPGKSVVVVGKQVQQRSRSGISWAGPLQGENGWATLILTDKGITGTLRSGTPQSGFTFYRFEGRLSRHHTTTATAPITTTIPMIEAGGGTSPKNT